MAKLASLPLDCAEHVSSEEREVYISAFQCAANTFSFYSPAGKIQGEPASCSATVLAMQAVRMYYNL